MEASSQKAVLAERLPTVEEFLALRENANWHKLPAEAVAEGLPKTLFAICAEDSSGKAIGMGRIVGDGSLQLFITDVIVHKEWQGLGIGARIMKALLEHIDESAPDGTMIGLCAARERESFYERFGFEARPNDRFGAGMISFSKKGSHGRRAS